MPNPSRGPRSPFPDRLRPGDHVGEAVAAGVGRPSGLLGTAAGAGTRRPAPVVRPAPRRRCAAPDVRRGGAAGCRDRASAESVIPRPSPGGRCRISSAVDRRRTPHRRGSTCLRRRADGRSSIPCTCPSTRRFDFDRCVGGHTAPLEPPPTSSKATHRGRFVLPGPYARTRAGPPLAMTIARSGAASRRSTSAVVSGSVASARRTTPPRRGRRLRLAGSVRAGTVDGGRRALGRDRSGTARRDRSQTRLGEASPASRRRSGTGSWRREAPHDVLCPGGRRPRYGRGRDPESGRPAGGPRTGTANTASESPTPDSSDTTAEPALTRLPGRRRGRRERPAVPCPRTSSAHRVEAGVRRRRLDPRSRSDRRPAARERAPARRSVRQHGHGPSGLVDPTPWHGRRLRDAGNGSEHRPTRSPGCA
ncbi:hypothetical protein FHR81_000364 [Actinoalloteichus hoggarensis]|uniref:Uncharacterized protein n=1 Tax=Actinoalloteichus hoggarensis TaxID=1470176 RepID=A0A221W2D4_9PSEU|nr:hypothetical protein AHOG_11560 [Actinoalloteichus hoggarensis]MBB5919335.1 hypothetical protein [Actinoalloteichus hoggarensis]